MAYSESHCHLGAITPEKVQKAKADGFTLLLTSGIDHESSVTAADTAKKFSIVKACVGVHPWYADEYSKETEAAFTRLAAEPEVVAISEIGLDFQGRMTKQWVREESYIDRDIQIAALEAQLALARRLRLPAIVHDRADGMELLNILLDSGNVSTGLAIHGFSKDAEYARKATSNGVLLSVGLRTIKSGNPEFMKAVKETPVEFLLTETDSSEPWGVLEVCDALAALKGLTRAEVGSAATGNLARLCHL